MRGLRYDRILAGTALALILSVSSHALAAPQTPADIEKAVPMPEPANLPPPTKADIGQSAKEQPVAPVTAAPAPATMPETPAVAAKPAPEAPTIASKPAEDQLDAAAIKNLTGKELVKAPIASKLSGSDVAVAEKLRDLLANKAERFFSRKNERSAVEAFYRDRGFAPLWSDKGAPSARATAAIAFLRGVDADGLEPADYPAPDLKADDTDALADAELKYTNTVLAYARHAQVGRVHFSRVSADIAFNLEYPDPAGILDNISGTKTMAEVLASYEPQHAAYKALKAKLAEVRGRKGDAAPARIPDGPVLKLTKDKRGHETKMEDARVPQLRERLGVVGDANDKIYDKAVVEAVKKFQKQHGIAANGVLNGATVNALNGPRRDRDADIIIANMERWRWLPRNLGRAYVILNIPDFTLRVMNEGKLAWTTRVVTGKPGKMATPLLTETMKYITVNPTWNVPPSIINNEYLPALQQDPDALTRIGLKMTQNPDGTVRIYQPPGEGNALGRIRFNFPNKFLVYQHDTPDKNLFAHEKRAYSHGCMRVQNPDKYAEVLLSIANPKDGYTAERIRKMYGGGEQNINLHTPIPVHITYQTAFVDDAGHLQIREDIYGRDAALLAILKGDSRKVADIAIERHEVSEKPQVARLPQPRSENPFASWFGRRDDSYAQQPQRRPTARELREMRRNGGRVTVREEEPSFFGRIFQ